MEQDANRDWYEKGRLLRWPRNIRRWVNVAAYDDYDRPRRDRRRRLPGHGLLGCEIQDLPKIHTFWIGREGLNPHKFYGYLDHLKVARVIGNWVMAEVLAAAGGP